MQSRGDGVKRGRNNQFPANIKTLSAQQTLIGSLLYLIKAAPTGVLRRNMFLNTHPDGNIIVIDEVKKIMKEVDEWNTSRPKYPVFINLNTLSLNANKKDQTFDAREKIRKGMTWVKNERPEM